MTKLYTCICCPNGCDIMVEIENGKFVSASGNKCKKGIDYVTQELTSPMRTIASSVLVRGGELPLASVRTTKAIPKDMIFRVMDEIRKTVLDAPVEEGTVIISNVCNQKSDIVVTKSVKKKN